MFFIDESGIITNTCPGTHSYREHYFTIAFVQTEDSLKLKRVFKRTMQKLRKKFPDFFSSLDNPKEPKGSELPPFMKLFIIEELITKTDINICHMVLDNRKITDVFRESSSRSFNFLIKLIILNTRLSITEKEKLVLNIDNRNIAIPSLKELEGYLGAELILGESKTKDIKVQYFDSQNSYGIQIADIFANLIYQRFRYKDKDFPHYSDQRKIKSKEPCHPYTGEYIYQYLFQSGRLVTPFMFPYSERNQTAPIFSL